MIQSTQERLPEQKALELKKWFKLAPYGTLRAVIESKVKEHQAKAAANAVESGEFPNKEMVCTADIKAAQRWKSVLDALEEIQKEEKLYTVKLH